ncbi:ATP-binding cassette domain-containing protein [Streptomyces sp. ActVer]|uniref:ATP-binding cassette domain-containing protein n=1 Tax=Streptomyces sp. ActVer TaxID=3014558 RepID=UPI0022B52D5E|nr:ATP-binding cassette domain-containing protein [Streptomyces sp. ActVer]MCZ4511760.1 ATP-binding cassette domain-containing protein [Streptomyces sp. ActVer]
MIEARELTKRYGDKTVVDNLTFTVKPGEVTGFLGPNGAGKSTTMRMVVGLDAPTRGSVTVGGRAYARHAAPLHEIGTLLEAKSVHPGRSAFNHLMALAYTHGISRRRVDEVIELAGLTSVAGKRVGAFSLGMGQRLGIASALLGDPAIVAVVAPRLTRRLLDAYAHQVLAPADAPVAEDPRLGTLSDREREVLVAIGHGWTNTEIAERLVLTESTVKKHVGRVLAKIGARDRIQAVIMAYDSGLVRAKS